MPFILKVYEAACLRVRLRLARGNALGREKGTKLIFFRKNIFFPQILGKSITGETFCFDAFRVTIGSAPATAAVR